MTKTTFTIIALVLGVLLLYVAFATGKRYPAESIVKEWSQKEQQHIVDTMTQELGTKDEQIRVIQEEIERQKEQRKYWQKEDMRHAQEIVRLKGQLANVKPPESSDEARKRFEAMGYKAR